MTAKVILNPYSNRWTAGKRQSEMESALRAADVDYELVVSQKAGQVVELAEQAAREGFSPVLAAGGDGTVGETVNGLVRAGITGAMPVMGILPMGTANDLAYNLRLPSDLGQAAKVIARGNARQMDLCEVNDRYFINNSGVGLEPYITTIQSRIGWIKGPSRYLVAAVAGIMDKPSWRARLEWEGGSFEGPLSLVTICNGARSGGMFFMGPHADPFDGKLTVVFGFRSSRRGMFALLPKTTRPGPGSYVESPGIQEVHTSWITIRLDRTSPAHVDGELFPDEVCDLAYKIHPARVQMLMGDNSSQ